MKTFRFLLALVLGAVSFSAIAAMGWHSGAACHATAVEAAAERCARFLGSTDTYVLTCSGVTSFFGCAASPVAGAACNIGVGIKSHNTAAGTYTGSVGQYLFMQACDAGDSPADKVADMTLLWGLFLGAALAIFLIRKLANLWESSPHVEH